MSDLYIFLGLLALGYTVGTLAEKLHYRSIKTREQALIQLPAVTMKNVDVVPDNILSAELVHGSAVISVDYFKRMLAILRNIFGGRVASYESLMDRARREALLRMKEAAQDASMIVNVRIETAAIGRSANRKGVGCLEAMAYGTAIKTKDG